MSWLIVPPDPTVLPLESFTVPPAAAGSNMNHWTLPIGTVVPLPPLEPDPAVTAAHHPYDEYTDEAAYSPLPSSSRPDSVPYLPDPELLDLVVAVHVRCH